VPVSERTKEIILSAAKDLFAQKGFFKTTYADIARHAGVNQATIYRGFKTKENIFKLLLEEEYKSIIKESFQSLSIEEPTLCKLKRLLTTNLRLTTQSRLFQHILRDEYSQFRDFFNTKQDKAIQELYSLIEKGMEKGEIKKEDPAFLVSVLLSFSYALRNLYRSEILPLESKYNLDHLVETINNVFIEGFIKSFTIEDKVNINNKV
jgi:TetR/AcrR family fatty acid metabolism transcriptional regulator